MCTWWCNPRITPEGYSLKLEIGQEVIFKETYSSIYAYFVRYNYPLGCPTPHQWIALCSSVHCVPEVWDSTIQLEAYVHASCKIDQGFWWGSCIHVCVGAANPVQVQTENKKIVCQLLTVHPKKNYLLSCILSIGFFQQSRPKLIWGFWANKDEFAVNCR